MELRTTPLGGGDPIDAAASISEQDLRYLVKTIAVPRHRQAQPRQNRRARDLVAGRLEKDGYDVALQGEFGNVVAVPPGAKGPWTLVGAHYDSVEISPGADDNASGVAVLLATARAIAQADAPPVCFVAFNGEEEGLLGSSDFTRTIGGGEVTCAHVLESVGYFGREDGSQRMPDGLPIKGPTVGDFIGLVGNGAASQTINETLKTAELAVPALRVVALKVFMGIERWLPVLHRSDHSPFWKAGIAAVMWTDTAEFRNANYHRPSDTPDTLDYEMLRRVAQLLTLVVLRPPRPWT